MLISIGMIRIDTPGILQGFQLSNFVDNEHISELSINRIYSKKL